MKNIAFVDLETVPGCLFAGFFFECRNEAAFNLVFQGYVFAL